MEIQIPQICGQICDEAFQGLPKLSIGDGPIPSVWILPRRQRLFWDGVVGFDSSADTFGSSAMSETKQCGPLAILYGRPIGPSFGEAFAGVMVE